MNSAIKTIEKSELLKHRSINKLICNNKRKYSYTHINNSSEYIFAENIKIARMILVDLYGKEAQLNNIKRIKYQLFE